MSVIQENIGIIGVGRLGSQLSIMLKEADYQISIVIDRDTYKAIKCMNECNALISSDSIFDIGNNITILFICVQDDNITGIANELAKNENLNKDLIIAHTSGLHTSEILHSVSNKNVHLCSFHPCYSFTSKDNALPEDIYYAVEGDDRGYERLEKVAECLGGKPFRINKKEKIVYHTACSMASNFLVGLMYIVDELLDENMEINKSDFLWPLVQGTLDNIKNRGIDMALTGPIIRGDAQTVRQHLKTLGNFDKRVVDLYVYIGEKLLQIAKDEDLSREKFKNIKKLFKKYKSGKL
ncbi:MAG: Rossmann-like and DUF2520 domain-containing protein [bacterium]